MDNKLAEIMKKTDEIEECQEKALQNVATLAKQLLLLKNEYVLENCLNEGECSNCSFDDSCPEYVLEDMNLSQSEYCEGYYCEYSTICSILKMCITDY